MLDLTVVRVRECHFHSLHNEIAAIGFDLDAANVGDGRFDDNYNYDPYYYIEGGIETTLSLI
jgi:hypothetical protein